MALTGDGGDEFFGGYLRYPALARAWAERASRPTGAGPMWELARSGARALGADRLAERCADRAFLACCASPAELHRRMMTRFPDPAAYLLAAPPGEPPMFEDAEDPLALAMAADASEYLPGDILAKVDRAAMAVGLETRAPLLDHALAEWTWTLPREFHVDAARTKKLLRRVLARRVPAEFLDRPKRGFTLPVAQWLRGPLRDWAEDLLSRRGLAQVGLLRVKPVRRLWKRFLAGTLPQTYRVWVLLMLQAWARSRTP